MFPSNSLIPFVTAGHPDLETSRRIILELARAGADLVEIGIPFSDPVADGPVIQRSSFDALRHGYTMDDYLSMVREIRRESPVPLIFMTYLNPVLQFGWERLDAVGADSGLDGILISDLTPESALRSGIRLRCLKQIYLVAPTTAPGRIEEICRAATGFVYVVARTGVTGRQSDITTSLDELVASVRRHARVPLAVGFGIRSREDVARIWEIADAAVVGSAIVSFVEEHRDRPDLPELVGEWVRDTLLPVRNR